MRYNEGGFVGCGCVYKMMVVKIHFYYVAQCVQRLAEMVIEFFSTKRENGKKSWKVIALSIMESCYLLFVTYYYQHVEANWLGLSLN